MPEQMTIASVLTTLERIERQILENARRSDDRHEETKRHLEGLRADVKLLRANDELHQGAVKGVERRIGEFEERMKKLEDEHTKAKRATDEGDQNQAAALQSAMTIQEKALDAVRVELQSDREARERVERTRAEESQAQTEALRTLVGWKDARWFRTAVFVGAVAGGFVAGLIATLASRGLLHFP